MRNEIIYNILDKIIKLSFTFFLSVFMARTLSKSDFGIYTIFTIIISSCLVISGAGFDTLYTKDVAKNKAINKNVFIGWISWRLLISIILFFIVRYYIQYNYPDYLHEGLFVSIVCLFVFINISEQTLVALVDNKLLLMITLTILLVFFILKMYFVYSSGDIAYKFVLDALEYLTVFIILILFLNKRFFGILSFNELRSQLYYYVKNASPLWLNGVVLVIYSRLDQFYVASVGGSIEIADYGIATNLNSLSLIIPTAIMTVYFPKMVQKYNEDNESYNVIFIQLIKLSLLYGIVWASSCYIFSKLIIGFVYGSEYIDSAGYLMLLSLSSVFLILGQVFGQHMIITGKYWMALKRSCFGIIFTLSAYTIYGESINIENIAIIVVINTFLVNVCSYLFMKDGFEIREIVMSSIFGGRNV